MMNNITWEEKNDDGLHKVEWSFWLNNFQFELDRYVLWIRQTKRHKWITFKAYERLRHRRYMGYRKIKLEDIPFSKEIMNKVLELFTKKISFRAGDKIWAKKVK